MNYETSTNFELASKLTNLYSGFMMADSQGDTDGVMVHDTVSSWYFNPCNNWRDIMPIAVELGEVTVSRVCAEILIDGYMYKKASYCDRGGNGQRALVICCIKVLEKDNV